MPVRPLNAAKDLVLGPLSIHLPTDSPDTSAHPTEESEGGLLERLDCAFQQNFAVLDTTAGQLKRVSADWPRVDLFRWLPLCEQVARRGRPEVIEDFAPLLLIAAPISGDVFDPKRIAVAVLLTEPIEDAEQATSAAHAFGVDPQMLATWAAGRKVWSPHAAVTLANALAEAEQAKNQAASTKKQLSEVSSQLLATFEELNLLHRLSEHLSLGRTEEELLEQSVQWLAEVLPADAVVAQLFDKNTEDPETLIPRLTLQEGKPLIKEGELARFFDRLGNEAHQRTVVLNRDRTSSPTWCYPGVRQVVSAPLRSHDRVIGWIAAMNHRPTSGTALVEEEFSGVEASLISSVASILAVHAGNRRLYYERSELFDCAVRAMSSAIDAKDPYTCGHSDRVARISVRLARELGLPERALNTLYLGGLLHDIGKIGIDDQVLRKPGKLTTEEYDHIKTHPELGERILQGIPQLAPVMPVVRHHHEAWDGSGYPDGLAGKESPLLARIAAVADSFDAMGSDRPYRDGMPIERVEEILREGSGSQWDPEVVDAYFAAREDILEISRLERDPLDLDVSRWEDRQNS